MGKSIKRLIVATQNLKKLQEIKEILRDLSLEVVGLNVYTRRPRIVEDGLTFQENAVKKAVGAARFYNQLCLGEDSGLEVGVLGGRPGVYSSRFSGPHADDKKNNRKLLRLLRGMPLKRRRASYQCAVALAGPEGLIGVVTGTCSGVIGFRSRGNFGFGYDPLFIIPRFGKTFAQLGPQIKHAMSHRYKALKKLRRLIKSSLAI